MSCSWRQHSFNLPKIFTCLKRGKSLSDVWGSSLLFFCPFTLFSRIVLNSFLYLLNVLCAQSSCLTLCDCMDCNPLGSSVHGISQVRVLEWVAISYSRGSSQPRDRSSVSCVSYIAGGFFYGWAPWLALTKQEIVNRICFYLVPGVLGRGGLRCLRGTGLFMFSFFPFLLKSFLGV